eukprot:CAMPEP_0197624044 /NCGR_PEP_ID=MMETSP1338-20131121/3856_1 /TAXON_ID=43686 ORGANISM="Pelagodinium beii, Strain RCC1491" /NCGR_SAMPLE_ID=MMETSP1338 /ASSEMBLY_ACC=CAM_ASM_000754 /LENGTH=459 /DNA_ID=CAMNT_0043194141 /DNA_START=52 /DNA_END=1432 /DNA_ORIENTATION=+
MAVGSFGPKVEEGMVEDIDEQGRREEDRGLAKVSTQQGVESLTLGDASRLLLREVWTPRKAFRVSIVAPGAGVGSVGSVFAKLGSSPSLQVDVVGKKGMPYDRYPDSWESGAAAPNLQTFARDIVRIGVPLRTDCFILGSRGGQVVLPVIWEAMGNASPPAVVVNGGCAMGLPGPPTQWPARAVTVMLLGGQDYFRGAKSSYEYLLDTRKHVSSQNASTAFLYVPEMKHMPQEELLGAVLPRLVSAALTWNDDVPLEQLLSAAQALECSGWGGRLCYTSGPGLWKEMVFGQPTMDRPPAPPSPRPPRQPRAPCPFGTAVSVTPIKLALMQTSEHHRQAAAEARRMAKELSADPQKRLLCNQLVEFAHGQDAEAWVAEEDCQQDAKIRAAPLQQTPVLRPHMSRAHTQSLLMVEPQQIPAAKTVAQASPIYAHGRPALQSSLRLQPVGFPKSQLGRHAGA